MRALIACHVAQNFKIFCLIHSNDENTKKRQKDEEEKEAASSIVNYDTQHN